MNQKRFFGEGSLEKVSEILKELNGKSIFLVTGKKSFSLCGAERKTIPLFKKYNVVRFNEFLSNPKIEEIERGIELFERSSYDVIIAIGGGSTIDVAKAIKLFLFKKYNKKTPLIAIPTTAGTGSEATHFIVYYKNKTKQSDGHEEITLPDYSICDPQLIYDLPKKIVADTGMDALSQAIESFWSINSTKESKEYAEKSIRLIISNIEMAANTPDRKSKENMMIAANLSGRAINITKTTVCHSISYTLTSEFNIAHGHAAGLTLGEVLFFNSNVFMKNCNDPRGYKYVRKTINHIVKLLRASNTKDAKEKIEVIMKKIGLETRFSEMGIPREKIANLSSMINSPERINNNPRKISKYQIQEILYNIY